ncbi:uncharacterized protein LOC112593883 [Melanaphis sacchari]|uniref:uncharacterized protein LOC112593883 n=1 Tax=Melanaphis sacchari TaxID=742174 RepID=UPI000DC15725|nr:uncharacterized protein LOC112593883 [Melanaphis sacchari]
MDKNNITYFKETNNTILSCLFNFITNANSLSNMSSTLKHNISLSVQFVTGIIEELEAKSKAIFKRNSKDDFCNVANYKRNTLNKEQQKYEQIKHDVQTKISRKNQIEHYFNAVDRQLQFVMKKKIMKSEAIIVAAMKEHEHTVVNLQLTAKSLLSKIESNAKNNEINKNIRMQIRNDLKIRKALIVQTYDSEMMEKHNNVNGFHSKIKKIEDTIFQLQESISYQMPFYNNVVLEKEEENDRVWHSKLHEIQRKIAARKIQMHFRRYLNYIKTRDMKKNKKGQHKKTQSKIKTI